MRLQAFVAVLLVPSSLVACGITGSGAVDMASGGQGAVSTGGATGSGGATASGGTSSGGAEVATGSGGQDASSGGQASGGQGSGGEPPICPGVVPECEPGVQGCSERGEAYLCSECGSMDLLGESCVRLLVSDKEMGQVCSVRGPTELLCAGGALEWDTELEFPLELPEFPSVFRLPDDASTVIGALGYCWLDEGGEPGCYEGVTAPAKSDCTDLALTDSSSFGNVSICTLCAGQLDCATATSEISVADVAQAGLSDTTPYWLSSDGSMHDPYSDEPILPGTFASIIMHDNGLPCGIRSDGTLVCAIYEAPELVLEGDFLRGSANIIQICLIDGSRAISCHSFEDGGFSPAFSPPGTDFVDVAVSNDKSCGLTRAGVVVCWDGEGMLDDFSALLN